MVVALSVFPWLKPVPSDSNFVLFEVLAPADAATVVTSLRRRGVLIRYYPSGPLAGYIRISAGRPSDTAGLMTVMHDIHHGLTGTRVAPAVPVGSAPSVGAAAAVARAPATHAFTAVLFDMDGVLVNVAASYRAAIVRTAARWGVTVTDDDIEAAKARGNANNDWALTLALITSAGVTTASGSATVPPTMDSVTAAFEELYQGTEAVQGLKLLEEPLLSTGQLREVKRRCGGKVGVVTGRPWRDAHEAIARYGCVVLRVLLCLCPSKFPERGEGGLGAGVVCCPDNTASVIPFKVLAVAVVNVTCLCVCVRKNFDVWW